MPKLKDTDYLSISARVRAMETRLLTRERMEQVLEARSDEEAVKILQECGYPELDPTRPEAMDAALAAAREATLSDLADSAPDARYLDIFKLKYDYHNIKAVLKAAAMNVSPDSMLMDMGRVGAAELKEAVQAGRLCVFYSADPMYRRLFAVIVEAFACLHAKLACTYHFL